MRTETDKHVLDFISRLSCFTSMDEAWDAYCCALSDYGVEHACYGFMATQPRKSVTDEVLSWSSHAPAFTDAYFANGHPDHDWSVQWSMTETRSQRWNVPEILEHLSPRQQQTENLAYDFGLYEGIVIPIRGVTASSWGGIGLAAPHLGATEWTRVLDTHHADLEILSQAFHETVLKSSYYGHFKLSAREQEVLQWVVRGLNKHEIADRLNISYRTAEVHMYRLRQKLQCVNDAQVVAKALVFNLVTP